MNNLDGMKNDYNFFQHDISNHVPDLNPNTTEKKYLKIKG